MMIPYKLDRHLNASECSNSKHRTSMAMAPFFGLPEIFLIILFLYVYSVFLTMTTIDSLSDNIISMLAHFDYFLYSF